MSKLKVLGGKDDQIRTIRRYIREPDHEVKLRQAANRITTDVAVPSESKPAINYILGYQKTIV